MRVCVAGKSSVGKSSTVNSLLGEPLARVQAFKLQADAEMVTPFVKRVSVVSAYRTAPQLSKMQQSAQRGH